MDGGFEKGTGDAYQPLYGITGPRGNIAYHKKAVQWIPGGFGTEDARWGPPGWISCGLLISSFDRTAGRWVMGTAEMNDRHPIYTDRWLRECPIFV